jgi:PXA domain/RUN domain
VVIHQSLEKRKHQRTIMTITENRQPLSMDTTNGSQAFQQQPQQQDLSEREGKSWAHYYGRLCETLPHFKIPTVIALMAIVASGNTQVFVFRVLYPMYWLCLRTIAVALGVALGLGFATHVYDQLERWTAQQRNNHQNQNQPGGFEQQQPKSISSRKKEETQALLMEHLRGASSSSSSSATGLLYDGSTIKTGKHYTKAAPSTFLLGSTATKLFHDSGSYAALMASAGYEVDPDYKRGAVVKKPSQPAYPFTDAPLDQQYALTVMTEEYPTLPRPIIQEIAKFMEFLMRDYVSTWYSMIDSGMPYPDYSKITATSAVAVVEQQKKNSNDKDQQNEQQQAVVPPQQPKANNMPQNKSHAFSRWMVFSNERSRQKPMMEHVYRSVAIALGNLAHRAQDINVFRLVLLKWIKVISHTFKAYRQLRKAILEKEATKASSVLPNNKGGLFEDARASVLGRAVRRTVHAVKSSTTAGISSNDLAATIEETVREDASDATTTASVAAAAAPNNNKQGGEPRRTPGEPATYQPVSEIAIAREFLFTGKLHPAVTFGLEIPSLLFSDPKGNDCGTGVESESTTNTDNTIETENIGRQQCSKTEDQVLEERLFQTPILAECELDYNRVLASRIVKLLLPRQDYGSPIVASLVTEILAGGVLAPTMSCFFPDYLNDWIIMLIDMMVGGSSGDDNASPASEEKKKDEQDVVVIQRTSSAASDGSTPVTADGQLILRTWGEDEEPSDRARNDMENAGGSQFLEDIYGDHTGGEEEMGDLMDLSSKQALDYSELDKEAAEEFLGTGSDARSDANDKNKNDAPDDTAADFADDDMDEEEDEEDDDIIMEETTNSMGAYQMISLLADALMNVQRQLELDDRQGASGGEVDWDSPSCKKAVLRLVLVVEALILHGRRSTPIHIRLDRGGDGDENQSSETLEEEFNASSFTQIMMDLTSDIEAFEKLHVLPEDLLQAAADDDVSEESADDTDSSDNFVPTPSDLSTLRTLIAAWLHTGQIYRTVSTLVKAKTTVLRPFYHSRAFLRNPHTSSAFTRHLRPLDGVDIMADTVAILNSSRLDPTEPLPPTNNEDEKMKGLGTIAEKSKPLERDGTPRKLGFKGLLDKGMQNLNDKKKAIGDKVNLKASLKAVSFSSENATPSAGTLAEATQSKQAQSNRDLSSASAAVSVASSTTTYSQLHQPHQGGTPRYLDYHRNEAFASSLRSERERRMESWVTSIQDDTEMIQVVSREKGATPQDVAYHRELHHVARIFYAGTNLIGIRDAARSKQRERLNTADSIQSMASGGSDTPSPEVSLLTVEMACSRRRIEVPDDDSSFLLRAQVSAFVS